MATKKTFYIVSDNIQTKAKDKARIQAIAKAFQSIGHKAVVGAVGDIGCYGLDFAMNSLGYPKPLTVSAKQFAHLPSSALPTENSYPFYAECGYFIVYLFGIKSITVKLFKTYANLGKLNVLRVFRYDFTDLNKSFHINSP